MTDDQLTTALDDELTPANGAGHAEEPAPPAEPPPPEDVPFTETEGLRLDLADATILIAQLRRENAQLLGQLAAMEQQAAVQERARAQRTIEERLREGGRYELLPGPPDGHGRRRLRTP